MALLARSSFLFLCLGFVGFVAANDQCGCKGHIQHLALSLTDVGTKIDVQAEEVEVLVHGHVKQFSADVRYDAVNVDMVEVFPSVGSLWDKTLGNAVTVTWGTCGVRIDTSCLSPVEIGCTFCDPDSGCCATVMAGSSRCGGDLCQAQNENLCQENSIQPLIKSCPSSGGGPSGGGGPRPMGDRPNRASRPHSRRSMGRSGSSSRSSHKYVNGMTQSMGCEVEVADDMTCVELEKEKQRICDPCVDLIGKSGEMRMSTGNNGLKINMQSVSSGNKVMLFSEEPELMWGKPKRVQFHGGSALHFSYGGSMKNGARLSADFHHVQNKPVDIIDKNAFVAVTVPAGGLKFDFEMHDYPFQDHKELELAMSMTCEGGEGVPSDSCNVCLQGSDSCTNSSKRLSMSASI